MPRFHANPKLSAAEEEALLKSLRLQREQKARVLLQVEAQNVARLKLADVAIERVPEEAAPLVAKDKKNFGNGNESMAVIAIVLNAVLLSASKADQPSGKGDAKGGKKEKAKAKAKPKIGAKIERLPAPTGDAAVEAIIKQKPTLERVCKISDKKSGEVKVKESEEAQKALLAAFEAWLCNGYNETVLPEAPKLLHVLSNEGLVASKLLSEYWANLLTTRASDTVELLELKAQSKEAGDSKTEAEEQLKRTRKEDADSAQELKWAAAEVQNARTGNQPSAEEVAREKAAIASDSKCRAQRLTAQKKVELHQKEQVTALSNHEVASKELLEKESAMLPFETMYKYGQPFFDTLVADAKPAATAEVTGA